MGALGESEAVNLELDCDVSEQFHFDRRKSTLEVAEALDNFFLEGGVLISCATDISDSHPIPLSRS